MKNQKPKKKMQEMRWNRKILLVYCSKCRKYRVARTEVMIYNKNNKQEITVISCAVCTIVQNLERLPKTKWVTYKEFLKANPKDKLYISNKKNEPRRKKLSKRK